jgi:hypothetical protein
MSPPALTEPRVARLTVQQVHTMLESGILAEGSKLELIDGLLVHKDRASAGDDPMTTGEKHNLVIKLLARLDAALGALGSHMQTQGPLRLSESDEPEPDGVVLLGGPRDYADRIPASADALSVIEVADSSLEYDRTTKAALYAVAGIAQYVIINLRTSTVEVHDTPKDGQYARVRVLAQGEALALRASPAATLSVPARDILP